MELYAMLFQQKQSSEEGGAGTIADLEAQEKDFVNLLSIIGHKEISRLGGLNIQPRLPPPGAR
jgi:hypothetical protein